MILLGRERIFKRQLVKLGQRNQDAWPMHHDNTDVDHNYVTLTGFFGAKRRIVVYGGIL